MAKFASILYRVFIFGLKMAVEIVFIVTDDTTTSQLLAMKFRDKS